MEHSLAPWQTTEVFLKGRRRFNPVVRVVAADGLTVAVVYGRHPDDTKVLEADARLAAAAPDLLLACEMALSELRIIQNECPDFNSRYVREYLEDVIAKAKGVE